MTFKKSNLAVLIALSIWVTMSGCSNTDKPAQQQAAVKTTGAKKPVIVEIILKKDSVFDPHGLGHLAKDLFKAEDVAQWKNRVTVYANVSDAAALTGELRKAYPTDSVVLFDQPFYNFNRSRCADTIPAKEWTNTFLTASLVADTKLQQEYLDYHKTQFEKWPEVSKGFCNAQFQQLLVFKQGRQLVIVISIPKGKTLDELNPLTSKNNPRVDEWNKRMAKYQEGLPGTAKGETWVFLKPVK